MKITRITMYQVNLPIAGGGYRMSGGRVVKVLDNTVVSIETDEGITGWGETSPFGSFYLQAFAAGARAGIGELAPHLIGQDPRRLGEVSDIMDKTLTGHPYVKAALDMASWDILGKAIGLPICDLLGGRLIQEIPLRIGITTSGKTAATAESIIAGVQQRRNQGFRHFSIKPGDDPDGDIERIRTVASALQPGELLVADANKGWLLHEAVRVARAVRDVDVYSPPQGWSKTLAFRRVPGCGSMVACQSTGAGRTANMTSRSTSSGSRSTGNRSSGGRWPSGSATYSARLRWNMN